MLKQFVHIVADDVKQKQADYIYLHMKKKSTFLIYV
jgi:hypothetical protein